MWQLWLPCGHELLAMGQRDGSAEHQMPRHRDDAWLIFDLFAYTATSIGSDRIPSLYHSFLLNNRHLTIDAKDLA